MDLITEQILDDISSDIINQDCKTFEYDRILDQDNMDIMDGITISCYNCFHQISSKFIKY